MFLAIFASVDNWPESTPDEQEVKFMALMYLLNILDKSSFLNDLFDILELDSVRRLQRIMNIQQIEKLGTLIESNGG